MSEYLQELDALQRWIKAAAGLNSVRLQAAPPAVARPVILWEAPRRSKRRELSRWNYVAGVSQYGKLYAENLDQLLAVEIALMQDLEAKGGVLPIYDQAGVQVAEIKAAAIEFMDSENLDVPFRVDYQVTYARAIPPVIPPASRVVTKLTTRDEGGTIIES